MGDQAIFHALAASLVAAVLAAVLSAMWREVKRQGVVAPARRRPWATTVAVVLGLPALTFGLYGLRGDPASLGAHRADLSAQLVRHGLPAVGEASAHLQRELAQHLERKPGDVRSRMMMARLDMRDGRYEQAATAFQQALAGQSKAALDAGAWVEYAEARAMAQGRTLAGEPRRLVLKALEIDSGHAQALDLAASAAWEEQDYRGAAMHWKQLLVQVPLGDPRHHDLKRAIERADSLMRLALPRPAEPMVNRQGPA